MNAPPCVPTERKPILTVKTSKNWVLPPGPKTPKEKPKDAKKEIKKEPKTEPKVEIKLEPRDDKPSEPAMKPSPPKPTCDPSAAELAASIGNLDKENYQLKIKLLSLIHDYKRLKSHLASAPVDPESPAVDVDSPVSASRKRVYTEVDPMNELISNMNHLSHRSPSDLSIPEEHELSLSEQLLEPEDALDLFNYVNLSDSEDEDEFESTSLSRSVSPGCSETDGEGSLMTSLTRSTTVSTNNSSVPEKKPMLKFYDLPAYSDSEYGFSFEPIDPQDKMLSVIEEDHYNQVADFLEEKLLSNDVEYYVDKDVR
ncbi:uncharacterized protein CXQ87_000979 [Candidozyma duobushaemuli]|uniref:Hap4 transcription factor heteromerisation domain-containing protein n=1 Tax=Candidozyma duobushaemuli TaxID=1231522 RepID=A0A2V1AK86_9ASCO|nr:uncharacterized protein CXQ87_000979 [[Candida] duobushaemulonis]PVH18064.1 hypothetical protein CXQ87_000979 [[Candida] duobushaemulonis]